MDYTTVDRVKSYMDSKEQVIGIDLLLAFFVTVASRQIDKLCTSQNNAIDYFKKEDVVDELLINAYVSNGILIVYPHKSIVNSVVELSYRIDMRSGWTIADLSIAYADHDSIRFYGNVPFAEPVFVKVSYNGGLATTTAGLPQDLQDLAALEAVRLYKEARSGLGDSIGVAELGTLQYTKAFPTRLLQSLNTFGYARIARW